MKMNEELKNYTSPVVEVVAVAVEKGFAASPGGNDPTISEGSGTPNFPSL